MYGNDLQQSRSLNWMTRLSPVALMAAVGVFLVRRRTGFLSGATAGMPIRSGGGAEGSGSVSFMAWGTPSASSVGPDTDEEPRDMGSNQPSDRGPPGGGSAKVRDEAATLRDEAAASRDEVARLRDELADLRDSGGVARDREAQDRDEVAGERDEAARAAECSAAIVTAGDASSRADATTAREDAAFDRRRSARDRDQASADRTASWMDRGASVGDRRESARDRDESATDRSEAADEVHTAGRDERHRLAEELHDEVVPFLAAAVLRLDLVDGSQGRVDQVRWPLAEATHMLRTTISEFAGVEVWPESLASMIADHAAHLLEPDGVAVEIASDLGAVDEIAPHVLDAAYRIVREALSNVRCHAQATKVRVEVRVEDGRLFGTVVDDGVGLDQDRLDRELARPGHLGLRLMRRRAAAAGGAVEFRQSGRGSGTEVRWWLPLADGGDLTVSSS